MNVEYQRMCGSWDCKDCVGQAGRGGGTAKHDVLSVQPRAEHRWLSKLQTGASF